jgi:hypothetical protein
MAFGLHHFGNYQWVLRLVKRTGLNSLGLTQEVVLDNTPHSSLL